MDEPCKSSRPKKKKKKEETFPTNNEYSRY